MAIGAGPSYRPRIAVIGAGVGGTAVARLLQQRGYAVQLYEQAPAFDRLGAGINLAPNAVNVLKAMGIADKMISVGIPPRHWVSRTWDTGEAAFFMPLGDAAIERYGAPYLLMHRGDMQAIMTEAVAPGSIAFGKRLVELDQAGDGIRMIFADGTSAEADMVIGADGVNSRVREILLGPEPPTYSGYVAHRAIIPRAEVGDVALDDLSKWWAEDTHLLVYFLTHEKSEVYLVTGVAEPNWPEGVSSMPGDIKELRRAFEGFHPTIQHLLSLCGHASKWPLLEREPHTLWSRGRIVLLGDACHPMKPHMGAGAAMAIEDAAIFVRCLEATGGADPQATYRLYEANRIERTTAVQRESHRNEFLRQPMDPAWVYGYNAMTVPLIEPNP